MAIWAPETEGDFDRIYAHNEQWMEDDALQALMEWLREQGDALTVNDGREHTLLLPKERYCHRNYKGNKRKQYIFVFRESDRHDIEILAVYSSNENWNSTVAGRAR
jgi:plasmid stabilization system protein ParE